MRRGRCVSAAAALAAVMLGSGAVHASGIPPHAIVAYDSSWDEAPAEAAVDTALANLPGYISVVDLAFARPDLQYSGDLDLSHTGLEYRFPGWELRDAIAVLKARQPDTKVLLSVGGAVYGHWRSLNVQGIARLVSDLQADGVDIDYEPKQPGCAADAGAAVHCATDSMWPRIVQQLRTALPRPALLTASVWSVGAYGEGAFQGAQPRSRYTGFMLRFLHSPAAPQLDLLSINAYDAGPAFDPMQAFRAYRAVWPGPLALGLAVARRGGSGPFVSADAAEMLARQVSDDPLGAMMVYPLLAAPDGARSDNLPDGRGLARAMCRGMALAGCDADWAIDTGIR